VPVWTELGNLDPHSAVPGPAIAERLGLVGAPKQNDAARAVIGHGVAESRRWPRVLLLRPVRAIEFPGIGKIHKLRDRSGLSAEQDESLTADVESHCRATAGRRAGFREFCPIRSVPLPGVSERLVVCARSTEQR
jgi:hypothetical protein